MFEITSSVVAKHTNNIRETREKMSKRLCAKGWPQAHLPVWSSEV